MVPTHLNRLSDSGNAEIPLSPDICTRERDCHMTSGHMEGVTWPQVLQVRTEHWWRLDSPWASSAPAAACRHKQEAQNLLHMLSSVFHFWLRLRRSLPPLLFWCFLLNSTQPFMKLQLRQVLCREDQVNLPICMTQTEATVILSLPVTPHL